MFDPNDPPPLELVETCQCPLCHRDVPIRETSVIGGRRLCFGCASSWYGDDDDDSEE
jgi:hypothetical protein